ncbi:hypothetical protein [Rhizobium laguerreae]|uniref:hypothetical protein n=1 Tax=Rhizobium laguerreae TaxID=1076926 RepID=UPI001C920CA9|nr:hypothetical protein [Rhizobium laguerreae]MBY3378928.1 hypothetical protein [Rhizobium laguerreae]
MAEVRLQIPDELLESFQKRLGTNVKATDIAKDAISLFNWAVGERASGRLILSSDQDGEKQTQVTMPRLDSVKTGT